jgi:nucleotide-binding universal stress UspA family protein
LRRVPGASSRLLGMPGTIVVGVDDTEHAAEALRWGLEEARLRNAALVAIHAWAFVPPPALSEPGMIAIPVDLAGDLSAEREAAQRSVERIVEDVLGADAGMAECRTVEGEPGEILVAASQEVELVVVGSRGRHGIRASLLGSVSGHVVQHAHCPVVIVRHHPPDEKL